MNSAEVNSWKGRGILAGICLLAGWLWLVLFPALARHPEIQSQIQNRQERGLDLGAMFYTDLPAAENAEIWLNESQDCYPNALWIPAPAAE